MEDKEIKQNKIIKIIIYALFIYIILNLLIKVVMQIDTDDSISFYYISLIPLLIIYVCLMIKFGKNKMKNKFLIIFFFISMCIPVASIQERDFGPSYIESTVPGKPSTITSDRVLRYESSKLINMYGITLKKGEWKRGK